MGRAILSKSLIQFSVDVWGCVPSLLFDLGQTMVEVMKIMATSFKRSQHALLHSLSPTLQQATANPRLHQRFLDTHRQVWVSLLWGHCSFLRGPGGHKVLFVPAKSLFPQPCVSSGSSMVELMVTLWTLKRTDKYICINHPCKESLKKIGLQGTNNHTMCVF